MADISIPPSCLKRILGVEDSPTPDVLAVSDSIITVASPLSPDDICHGAAGFVVPMPTLSGLIIVSST